MSIDTSNKQAKRLFKKPSGTLTTQHVKALAQRLANITSARRDRDAAIPASVEEIEAALFSNPDLFQECLTKVTAVEMAQQTICEHEQEDVSELMPMHCDAVNMERFYEAIHNVIEAIAAGAENHHMDGIRQRSLDMLEAAKQCRQAESDPFRLRETKKQLSETCRLFMADFTNLTAEHPTALATPISRVACAEFYVKMAGAASTGVFNEDAARGLYITLRQTWLRRLRKGDIKDSLPPWRDNPIVGMQDLADRVVAFARDTQKEGDANNAANNGQHKGDAVGGKLGYSPSELADKIGCSTESIRQAARRAKIKRPTQGQHGFKYPREHLLHLADARAKAGCGEREKQAWNQILKENGEPSIGFKPKAKSKRNPT